MATKQRIRYTKFNRRGELATFEKSFPSEEAMDRWIDQNDDKIIDILAYGEGD